MQIEKEQLKYMVSGYFSGSLDHQELAELLDDVAMAQENPNLDHVLEELMNDFKEEQGILMDSQKMFDRITNNPMFKVERSKPRIKNWWRISAVAAVLLLGLCVFFFSTHLTSMMSSSTVKITRTIAPSSRPMLRLADGRMLDLDSTSNGILATQGNTNIIMKDQALHYENDTETAVAAGIKNTIVIPKGRQYQLVLPDGTKIWLNTATTLTFPVKFDKHIREVAISGEAYFEVAHAEKWPFVVHTKDQKVEVLGTYFNISTYKDDDFTKTTLVKGRVRVAMPEELRATDKVLQPGQQALTFGKDHKIQVSNIDTEEVTSWRNNLFIFNNEEISEVMQKVSRWYDVEVEYRDGMEGKKIGGTIPRFEDLNELLKALQATGLLHYKMEGGKVIIMR